MIVRFSGSIKEDPGRDALVSQIRRREKVRLCPLKWDCDESSTKPQRSSEPVSLDEKGGGKRLPHPTGPRVS